MNKKLLKDNFEKSLYTYDNFAVVQKEMAQDLVSYLPLNKFENILEIGSYSGILTKEIVKKIEFKSYLALDIVNASKSVKNINPEIEFQNIDVEKFTTDKKFNLIISNASLQWTEDFKGTIKKLKSMLNKEGIIAISIFAPKNLYEIKDAFNIGLNYPSQDDLEKIFSKNAKIIEKIKILEFKDSKEILKHLKLTGVNSIEKNIPSFIKTKNGMNILDKKYNNKITYNPLFIID